LALKILGKSLPSVRKKFFSDAMDQRKRINIAANAILYSVGKVTYLQILRQKNVGSFAPHSLHHNSKRDPFYMYVP
jgi:hypothetical protein